MKWEDFYPITDNTALIVCGVDYTQMHEIREAEYTLQGELVVLGESKVIKTGKNVRLGNYYHGELVFSEGYEPVKIQPYRFDGGLLYQTKGNIYLNDEILFTPWDNFKVLGRPTYHNGWVFFETREGPAPQTWEVWKYNLETKQKVKVLNRGANPYVYKDKVFYSFLNGNAFETRWTPLVP